MVKVVFVRTEKKKISERCARQARTHAIERQIPSFSCPWWKMLLSTHKKEVWTNGCERCLDWENSGPRCKPASLFSAAAHTSLGERGWKVKTNRLHKAEVNEQVQMVSCNSCWWIHSLITQVWKILCRLFLLAKVLLDDFGLLEGVRLVRTF